jgi:hypothetical protein
MCLANYGASEAIYLCNIVEKIYQYFRPKMRHVLENKISRSLTSIGARYLPVSTEPSLICTGIVRL